MEHLPRPYFEVFCKSSNRTFRFSEGTVAGFAVSAINRKLKNGLARALYIEAVKEGQEAIAFGTDAVLVDYGHGWKLQTLTEDDEKLYRRMYDSVVIIKA